MDDFFRNRGDLERNSNGQTDNLGEYSMAMLRNAYQCQELFVRGIKTDGDQAAANRPLDFTLLGERPAGPSVAEIGGPYTSRKRKVVPALSPLSPRFSPSPPGDEAPLPPPPGWQPLENLLDPAPSAVPRQHRSELRQHLIARERRRQFFSRTYRATHPTSGGRVDVTLRGSPSAISHVEMGSLPYSRRLSSPERVAGRDALTSLIRRSLCTSGPLSSRTLPVATVGLQPTLIRGQSDPRPPLSRTNSCLVNIAGRPARMSITVTHRTPDMRSRDGVRPRQRTCHGGDGNIGPPPYPAPFFSAAPLQVNNYVNPPPYGFAYQAIPRSVGSFASGLNGGPPTVPSTTPIFSPVNSSPIYEEIVNLDENLVFHNYMRGGTDFRTIDAHTLVYKYTAPASHSPKKRKTESHVEKCPICLEEIGHLEYINRRCPICRNDITGKGCLDNEHSGEDEENGGDCSDVLESDYEPLDEEDEAADELALLSSDE